MKDKKGQEIQKLDLLKVFHFIGARNKKHYMYKWVGEINTQLVCYHLDDSEELFYSLLCHHVDENNICKDIEIVQSPLTLKKELSLNASSSTPS